MKLKEVGMKKALEVLGATDIKVNRKGFWYVSGEFTLDGKRYRYGSLDLRRVTVKGSDDIDLNAVAPLYYYELLPHGQFKPTRDDLNERFAAAGVRVPMRKHEYSPWNEWKRCHKPDAKVIGRCGHCAHYHTSGVCSATGLIRSVHPDDRCRWGKFLPKRKEKSLTK